MDNAQCGSVSDAVINEAWLPNVPYRNRFARSSLQDERTLHGPALVDPNWNWELEMKKKLFVFPCPKQRLVCG
uniref:Uncharacterized protein n=1 Tax=Arundo donax TaxID=35708 RepID=A0A0A9H1I0_ARUDO